MGDNISDISYNDGGSSVIISTINNNIFANLNNSNHGYSSQAAYEGYLQTQNFKKQEQIDWANFEQPNVKGAGWSSSINKSTFTYNYNTSSNLYHSAFSVNDILQQFGSPKDAINPYSERVVYKETHNNSNGETKYYYMNNPAYTEFENIVKQMQNTEFQAIYDAGSLQNENSAQEDFLNLQSGYDNGLYGAGTLSINTLAQNITDLQKQINDLELSDSISANYNRINNTDHSKEINALKAQLGAFQEQYDSATSDYEHRYDLAKAKQDEASSSNWVISSSGWIQGIPYDAHISNFNSGARQDTNNFSSLLLSGEMNSWMAGGNLYDAPRAGDVMFNVLGNMNTVRFLGIEDTNKIPDMVKEFVNPELFRSLGNMAGDDNFSVIPPTVYS